MEPDERAPLHDLGRGGARGRAPADAADLRAQGSDRAAAHEGRSRRYSERDIALLQRIQELTKRGRRPRRASSASSRSRRARRRAPAHRRARGARRGRRRGDARRASSSRAPPVPARARAVAAARTLVAARTRRRRRGRRLRWPSTPTGSPARPKRRSAPRRRRARAGPHRGRRREHLLARARSTSPRASSRGVLERIGVDLGDVLARASTRRWRSGRGERRDRARRAARAEHVPRARGRRQGARRRSTTSTSRPSTCCSR